MQEEALIKNAVEQGGSYEVIKRRLDENSKKLQSQTEQLNEARKAQFGNLKQELIAKINVHSENACIPVDMTEVNGHILFGYNVFMGMKSQVSLDDIFTFYKMEYDGSDYHAVHVPVTGSFLDHTEFKKAFNNLFSYYKDVSLFQLLNEKQAIFVAFQVGNSINDLKVFKWQLNKQGEYVYEGETSPKEIISKLKNSYNKWVKTDRSNFIAGKHPHISIKDKLFVETIGGDLTIKTENNTDDGQGIYSEPVKNAMQNLEDSDISYVDVGDTVLLKIKPYQEEETRYFIFNTLTQNVIRCDGIGLSCVELPEDHGFIFSDGYYLKSGEYKKFDVKNQYFFLNSIKSPNGEDYLYVFFNPYDKNYVLYPYNLVTKTISSPIFTNGYSLYEDGRLYVSKASTEPTHVHPLDLWQTSYLSDTVYAKQAKSETSNFYTKIGNSELVRCISDIYTVNNLIMKKGEVSLNLYEAIIKMATKLTDDYHWLGDSSAFGLKGSIQSIVDTAILVINEFEKVVSIQKQAREVLEKSKKEQKLILTSAKVINDKEVSKYIEMLGKLKSQLGHLITMKGQRYIDLDAVTQMENEINEAKNSVNEKLIVLLQDPEAFVYYVQESAQIDKEIAEIKKVVDFEQPEERLNHLLEQINIVNGEINDIDFKDPTVISAILDSISSVFAKLNQIKAKIKNIRKSLMSEEAKLEFAAQFKLLSQSVSSAITTSDTPEKCDENMTRVLNQVEALESKFSDFDEFLVDIHKRREDIKDTFENHKQILMNERQKRINSIENASKITLSSIQKKVEKIRTVDEMNSYFASDAMVLKYDQFVRNIKDLGDNIKSDELFGLFKNIKDQALRQLRDTQDIFEDNGNIMKMGKHRFSVSKTPFDLTLINKDGKMFIHLTSTNFYQEINHEELNNLKQYWEHDVISESADLYRAEFLAYSVLKDAESNEKGLSFNQLEEHIKNGTLDSLVSSYSATLYKEGYIKGVHDVDASLILTKLFEVYKGSGSLKYSKTARLLGSFYNKNEKTNSTTIGEYEKAIKIRNKINNSNFLENVLNRVKNEIDNKVYGYSEHSYEAAEYLLGSLSNSFEYPTICKALYQDFKVECSDLIFDLNTLEDCNNMISVMQSYGEFSNKKEYALLAAEIVIYMLNSSTKDIKMRSVEHSTIFEVDGLIGQHSRVVDSKLTLELDRFISRAEHHKNVVMPAYEKVNDVKYKLLDEQRNKLRIQDFKAKPLSSFVRNKLITEAYLPLIGDNFAKQMGTVGEKKRTDLMGLLLLISPPGYGKTTIIEYLAQKLGLVFMKINCPSLGHSVTSLDPSEAPDVTSRKEVEKINIAFEMSNNVLLYLDDIQHTNPEFLQKFISLCDGSRRIDGVWNGQPKTYDLKGKKFAIVMAGNPYTESGEVFKIPDMLSNRADIYNLGDMLSGQQNVFELSYIENSLTSNDVLAPLATRNLEDLYKFIEMAQGQNHPLNEFEYNYSQAEANEIVDVIKKMISIQKVVLKVNQQYIASAATADQYRVEPAFKLQGSYRNMNKMSEKVVSAMNDSEVNSMILDHYLGEAQTLTQGTEENLLKLKELLGIQTDEEKARWDQIKKDYLRNKTVGNADTDGFTKIAQQIALLSDLYKDSIENDASDDKKIHSRENMLLGQLMLMNKNMAKVLPDPEKDRAITSVMNTLNEYILARVNKNVKQNKNT